MCGLAAAPGSELASVHGDIQQLKAAVDVLTNATHLMAIPTASTTSLAEPGEHKACTIGYFACLCCVMLCCAVMPCAAVCCCAVLGSAVLHHDVLCCMLSCAVRCCAYAWLKMHVSGSLLC